MDGLEWRRFETDYGDHYETPKRAYRDIKPVLKLITADAAVTAAAEKTIAPTAQTLPLYLSALRSLARR